MRGNPYPSAPRRTDSDSRPPQTPAGLVVAVVLAAAIPLALYALAHPTVVAAALTAGGVTAAVRVRR